MKSNPYKNKKYRIRTEDIKKAKCNRKIRFPELRIKAFFKNAFHRERHLKSENIYNKEVYVGSLHRNRYPAWLLPLLAVIGISLVVFWIGPFVLNTMTKVFLRSGDTDQYNKLKYASNEYAVVSVQSADLFDKPDLKAERKTQFLYNQVIKILDRSVYGFYQVQIEDGTTGYIMSDNVTDYTECAEPLLYKYKLVITSKSKKIMTHSSNGSTIIEIMMGTILYSNYQGDDVYKVSLPDRTEGWINANGVLKINSSEEVKKSNAKSFYTTVLSFNDTTFINQGLTKIGASSDGIAFIAAIVNGVVIPRDKQKQSEFGENIKVIYYKESGLLKYDEFLAGDLIFFKSEQDPEKVGEMGIIVGYGQVLMSRSTAASVKIINLDEESNLAASVLAVRRIF